MLSKSMLFLVCFFISGALSHIEAQTMDKKSESLHNALIKKNGGWEKLVKKKDVQFSYIYDDKSKGIDLSTERHTFDGEHSWASYTKHEVNVLPGMPGVAFQSYINRQPQITLDGKLISDEKAIGGTTFLREVNFFWFTMMYKLGDPSTVHEYQGSEIVNGINYDKVKLSYKNEITGKPADDAYVLYYNPKSKLIDLFYFSLPAFGVNDIILKMECDYEKVDGILLTTSRRAYGPDQDGKYNLLGEYTTSNISFNNGFKAEDFILEY